MEEQRTRQCLLRPCRARNSRSVVRVPIVKMVVSRRLLSLRKGVLVNMLVVRTVLVTLLPVVRLLRIAVSRLILFIL